ncbi:MAG: hypothetical protein V8R91_16110 [Butyricimonas faecihominis]
MSIWERLPGGSSRYQKDRMKAHRLAYVVGESRFIPLNYALQDEYEDGFSMYSFYKDINGMNADEIVGRDEALPGRDGAFGE